MYKKGSTKNWAPERSFIGIIYENGQRIFLRLKAHYSKGVAFSLRILLFYISRRISNMGLLCSYDDQHII